MQGQHAGILDHLWHRDSDSSHADGVQKHRYLRWDLLCLVWTQVRSAVRCAMDDAGLKSKQLHRERCAQSTSKHTACAFLQMLSWFTDGMLLSAHLLSTLDCGEDLCGLSARPLRHQKRHTGTSGALKEWLLDATFCFRCLCLLVGE
jgi:hypothetical protein